MESVLRLPAQQSLFNTTNTLVDLMIPGSSGVYDLSQSFVAIQTRLTPEKSAVDLIVGSGQDNGVYDVRLHFKHNPGAHTVAAASIYDNTATPIECLVSSCSMISASRGAVEDIRRADILRGTLSVYQKDLDSRQAESLTSWAGAAKDHPWVHGQYVELYGSGSLNSREITHEIRLPLKDLFDAGHFDAWDSAVYGDTRIHLELNLGQVLATQCCGLLDPTWTAAYQQRTTDGTTPDLAQFGYRTARPDPTVDSDKRTIAAGGGNFQLQSLTMQTKYDSLADSPWWVGQDVTVQCFNSGTLVTGNAGLGMLLPVAETIAMEAVAGTPTAGAARRAIILSIDYDKLTKLLTLNFAGDVVSVPTQGAGTGGATGGGILEIRVTGSDTLGTAADTVATLVGNAAAISYESIELVATMRTDLAAGQAPKQHQYSHFVNQADTFSQQSGMQRTYQIPANCSAVVIAVTNAGAAHSEFLGSARVQEYRFTIDGEQVTNRPVPYIEVGNGGVFNNVAGSSLHYDLIQKTFLNIGVNARYQSLKESVYDQLIPTGTPGTDGAGKGFAVAGNDPLKNAFLLCTPMPMKDQPSQLLVEMSGNFVGGGSLQIYSYVTSLI